MIRELHDYSPAQVAEDFRAIDIELAGERPALVVNAEYTFRAKLAEIRETAAEVAIASVFLPPLSAASVVPDKIGAVLAREARLAKAETSARRALLLRTALRGKFTPKPHQLRSVARVLTDLHGTAILADEVGLGKTITAGLLALELFLREPASSCLILVPPNLLGQWKRELALLGMESQERDFKFVVAPPLPAKQVPRLLLMSLHAAKQKAYARILIERSWSLVIVDEAHELRNPETQNHRLVFSLTARHRLLLTATPVNNSAYDIFHLVNLVRPGFLGTKPAFEARFAADDRAINDPAGLQLHLEGVLLRQTREGTGIRFAERRLSMERVGHQQAEERALYQAVLTLLRSVWKRHAAGAVAIARPSGKEHSVDSLLLTAMLVLRELGSHPKAALATLGSSLRRHLVHAADHPGLKSLDVILKRYATVGWGAGYHAKTDRLVEMLPALMRRHAKIVVFVGFLETQKALIARIEEQVEAAAADAVVLIYNGEMAHGAKERSLLTFASAPRAILICTDAGGQGLNLQTASAVVNFDFPWNPMRVEQRIGRVDRIGQTHDQVEIVNFLTTGTIEEYVYAVLEEKLRVCEDVMGSFRSPVLRLMMKRRDEELGIGEIILSSADELEMKARFAALAREADALLAAPSHATGLRSAVRPATRGHGQFPVAPTRCFAGRLKLGRSHGKSAATIEGWRVAVVAYLPLGVPAFEPAVLWACGCCGGVFVETAAAALTVEAESNAAFVFPPATVALKIEEQGRALGEELGEGVALRKVRDRLSSEMRTQSRQLVEFYVQRGGSVPRLNGFPRRDLHSEPAVEAEREARLREIAERFHGSLQVQIVSMGHIRNGGRTPFSRRKPACLGRTFSRGQLRLLS